MNNGFAAHNDNDSTQISLNYIHSIQNCSYSNAICDPNYESNQPRICKDRENSAGIYCYSPCSRGKYVSVELSGSTKQACEHCLPGKYSNRTDQKECSNCSVGKYAPNEGNLECITKTVCIQDQYVAENGDRKRDRRCGNCPTNMYTRLKNSPRCEPCDYYTEGNVSLRDDCLFNSSHLISRSLYFTSGNRQHKTYKLSEQTMFTIDNGGALFLDNIVIQRSFGKHEQSAIYLLGVNSFVSIMHSTFLYHEDATFSNFSTGMLIFGERNCAVKIFLSRFKLYSGASGIPLYVEKNSSFFFVNSNLEMEHALLSPYSMRPFDCSRAKICKSYGFENGFCYTQDNFGGVVCTHLCKLTGSGRQVLSESCEVDSQIVINSDTTILGTSNFVPYYSISGRNRLAPIEIQNGTTLVSHIGIIKGSSDYGGAMAISGINTVVTLQSCLIANNYASTGGGGIHIFHGSTLFVKKCTFTGNVGSYRGGGMLVTDGATVFISNSTFKENVATRFGGGGLYLSKDCHVKLMGTYFNGNTAHHHGGALFGVGGTFDINNSTFIHNTASEHFGGGIYLIKGSQLNINGSLLAQNYARHRGGALFSKTSEFKAYLLHIQENIAEKYDGGGLFAVSKSNLMLHNSKLIKNVAKYNGGGLFLYKSKILAVRSVFERNTATRFDGGGLTAIGQSEYSLIHCNFRNNYAHRRGTAAFFSTNSAGTPINTQFTVFSQNTVAGKLFQGCENLSSVCNNPYTSGSCEDTQEDSKIIGVWCKRQCEPGFFHTGNLVTAANDRICEPCAAKHFTTQTNLQFCVLWTVCYRGTYISNAGSPSRDVTCSTCRSGRFTDHENARKCSDWTTCPAGTYVSTAGNLISNKECKQCPYGQYTKTNNIIQCTNWSIICSAGFYVAFQRNQTADTLCRPCTQGFFAESKNMTSCRPFKVCHTGYDFNGDAKTDARCTRCPYYMKRWPNVPSGRCYLCSVWGQFSCKWLQFTLILSVAITIYILHSKSRFIFNKLRNFLGLKTQPNAKTKISPGDLEPMSNWGMARNKMLNRKPSLYRTVQNKLAATNNISDESEAMSKWRKAKKKILKRDSSLYQTVQNKLAETNGSNPKSKWDVVRSRKKKLLNHKKARKTVKHSLRKKRKTKVNSTAVSSHRKFKTGISSINQKEVASSREAKHESQTKQYLGNSTPEAGRKFENRTKISPIKTAQSEVRVKKALNRHKALMAIASAADEPASSDNDTIL